MQFSIWLKSIIPNLWLSVLRFPAAIAVCVLTAFAVVGGFGTGTATNDWQWRFFLAGSAGFFAAGAAQLLAEGRAWPHAPRYLLGFAAGALAWAAAFWPHAFQTSLLFLLPGAVLLLMVAPYLRRQVEQGAIWYFNCRIGLIAILAFFVALAFAASVSAIFAGADALLGLKVYGNAFEHVWWVSAVLIGPVFGLSLVPHDLNASLEISDHRGTLLERAVSIAVTFIFIPLVLCYAILLHAYAFRLLFGDMAGDGLRLNEVGWIVAFYGMGGGATWLVAWPWREEGNRLIRFFIRWWPAAMLAPLLLLCKAVIGRVTDAGIMPERYGLIVIAIWMMLGLALIAARKGKTDLRVILGSLAFMLLIGSSGPLGSVATSVRSQFARLNQFATENSLLDGTRLRRPLPQLSHDTQSAGKDMVIALANAGGLYRLAPWFEGDKLADGIKNDDDNFALGQSFIRFPSWDLVSRVSEGLGLGKTAPSSNFVNFYSNKAADLVLDANSRLVGPLMYNYIASGSSDLPKGMKQEITGDVFRIAYNDKSYSIPVVKLAGVIKDAADPSNNLAPAKVTLDGGATLIILNGAVETGATERIQNLSYWLILPQ